MKLKGGHFLFAGAAAIVLLLMALGLPFLLHATLNQLQSLAKDYPQIPTLVVTAGFIVVSVALLTILLTLMTFVFSLLGLSDPRQALGLPDGSVRAMIALFLLTMFVIFAIYLYNDLSAKGWQTQENVTEAQKDSLTPGTFVSILTSTDGQKKLYKVWFRVPVNEAAERFAQQAFTAALTLVTAVSAFYFASRVGAGGAVGGTSGGAAAPGGGAAAPGGGAAGPGGGAAGPGGRVGGQGG
jgi:hypothetical protein